jgi:prepilin-type N-terminal cleavage/methylation domain-containing protein
MTLKIGNRRKGFTFIEVMAATVMLAVSSLFIYEALFRSIDAYNYCRDYLSVVSWANEKVWQAQDDIAHFNELVTTDTAGEFSLGNKNFSWSLSKFLVDTNPLYSLYRVDLNLSWKGGAKMLNIQRIAFAGYAEKIQ